MCPTNEAVALQFCVAFTHLFSVYVIFPCPAGRGHTLCCIAGANGGLHQKANIIEGVRKTGQIFLLDRVHNRTQTCTYFLRESA